MKTNKGSVLMIALIIFLLVTAGGVTYYSVKKKTAEVLPAQNIDFNSENTNLNTTPKTTPTTPTTTPVNNQTNNTNTVHEVVMSPCGITITSPAPDSIIHSNTPVVFSGVINNSNAATVGCSWTMFEGEAGTAQLWHKDGGVWGKINSPQIIHVTNWMTTGPVPFTVSVSFNNSGPGFASGLPMKVVFTEENPSGEGIPDTIEIPLIFQ